MNLIKRFTPPTLVYEVYIEKDRTKDYFGYVFFKDKSGQVLHAADLKPHFADIKR